MPTYEYECDECKQIFEIEQKITDPVKVSPCIDQYYGCGGNLKRVIAGGQSGFILKGERWAKDGY